MVTMDCRGSRNRGVAFESHLKGRMGQVEIQDQVRKKSTYVKYVKFTKGNYRNYYHYHRHHRHHQ